MRRISRLLTCGILTALAVGLLSPAPADEGPPKPAADAADPASTGRPPVYLFLNTPEDLQQLLKKLEQPDFILMSGTGRRGRAGGTAEAEAPGRSWTAVVRSVAVQGEVVGDAANLALDVAISSRLAGPHWVTLRLDQRTVTEAREQGRLLPLRVQPREGWQVELAGEGEHRIRVELKVPLRSTTEGQALDLMIPEAPSTEVRLDVDRVVSEARAGANEPVRGEPIGRGSEKRTRLSAHLSPRARLDLSWDVEAEPGAELAPLLSIQGEIAIDVDPGAFRTRSSWLVKALRGSMRSLELHLDPEDEVLEVTLDGQPIAAGIERAGAARRLSIPLTEPLRPGPTKRLVMTTQRKLPPKASARLAFHGFPLSNAKEQSGAIGIAQSGNLVITSTAGRGLRQIDPRTVLPADLRVRPATFLGYQFVDQPFELELHVEPSPRLVRFDARTTVSLDARHAKLDTWLGAEAANGRLFDVTIALPRELDLEAVGPAETVESWQISSERDGERLLTARLTFRAQEASSFALHLTGRQTIDASRPVGLALFRPRESSLGGGRVAVLADRSLTVDLPEPREGAAGAEVFRPARQDPPPDWQWPAGRSVEDSPALWLRYDGNPASLPLRVTVHPRSVVHETSLSVQLGRRGIEGRQDSEFSVHFGVLDQIDIEVPRELVGRWEVEEGDVASRTDLGLTARGGRLFRLKLNDVVTDRTHLTFRFRSPLGSELPSDKEAVVDVPWLRFVEGTSAPLRVRVTSEPGIRVDATPGPWLRSAGDEGTAAGLGSPVQFRLQSPGNEAEAPPLRLTATALALNPLPPLIASRLWLRTIEGPDNDLQTSAWFWIESHESTLSIALPYGAEWIRARVGGEPVGAVEQLPRSAGYRFRFPSRLGSGPLLVALDYRVAARHLTPAWSPPRLIDGVILQTRWEVRVPSGREVLGVPSGWTDENEWYWDVYRAQRRPWKTTSALAAWASGSSSPATAARARLADEWDDDGRGDDHGYLFQCTGPPPDLRLRVVSRGSLVALCSGPVLGLGVLMVLTRWPPFRLVWLVVLVLGLAVAMAVQPSLTLQLVQPAMIGVVFTLLAAVLQRLVGHPRPSSPAVFGDPSGLVVGVSPGSSVSRLAAAGSDDSTAIRPRSVSTMDHVTTVPPPAPEGASGRGSARDPGK